MSPDSDPNTCGCFGDDAVEPPAGNRPGLPALAFRAATHPDSLRRMLTQLPRQEVVDPRTGNPVRPLAALATLSPDDFTAAVLDAWAAAVDVVTFYQERIANEGFLRTATERRSVLELARAIGYELSPGVAASAFLAFTVEDAPGAPGVAVVPGGTRVLSVPAQGQRPQTFETSATLTVRAEFNALRPRQSRPQDLAVFRKDGQTKLLLLGLSTSFPADAPGQITIAAADLDKVFPLDPTTQLPSGMDLTAVEVQRCYIAGTQTDLKVGQPMLFTGKRGSDAAALVLVIRNVAADTTAGRTVVDLAPQPFRFFFRPILLRFAVLNLQRLEFDADVVDTTVRHQAWRERDLSAFLSIQGWSGRSLARHLNTFVPIRLYIPPPPPPGKVDVNPGLFGFQAKAGFFGNNAPAYDSLQLPDPKPTGLATDWDSTPWNVWKRYPGNANYSPADVYLERTFPDVAAQSWALLENSSFGDRYTPYWVRDVHENSVTGFTLSAKATGLELAKADGTGLADADKSTAFAVRNTTAHVQSRPFTLARLPIDDPLLAGDTRIELDQLVLGLKVGQTVILGGERNDLGGVVGREALTLTDVVHSGGLTTLEFARTPLQHEYVRATVTLNANVAEATHGETVTEVLGSGDGTQAFQRFALAKPPLTCVTAATGAGARSTLRVRVNMVYWQEASALFGQDGDAEVYIVRRADDGAVGVQFGDGETGARLPTGAENVTAVYRSGVGLPGMVAADALTLLQTRPPGVRGVTNPLAASGAADPEDRDDAKQNAPLTVLTLDRIVSLSDYAYFTRAFAGVAKAQAVLLWDGASRVVHVTAAAAAPPAADPAEPAAPATREIDPASPLYKNLGDAIAAAHDPAQRVLVDTYQPMFFNVRARLQIDTVHYDAAPVLAAAEAALKDAFSFDHRDFGQRVTAAEVLTVLQGVTGVVAADLRQLYLYRDNEAPPDPTVEQVAEILDAQPARVAPTIRAMIFIIRPRRVVQPRFLRAQLLLVNPVGIALEEVTL